MLVTKISHRGKHQEDADTETVASLAKLSPPATEPTFAPKSCHMPKTMLSPRKKIPGSALTPPDHRRAGEQQGGCSPSPRAVGKQAEFLACPSTPACSDLA